VKNPVSNVTVATNIQQRQNLGRTKVRGVQTDLEYRLGTSLRVSGGYMFSDAKVTENERNPALVGKFLPQVPQHRGSLQVAYTDAGFANVSLGVQFLGRQFDDDLNSRGVPGQDGLGLPGYAVADLMVSRSILNNLEVFFGVQNLFDEEYFVGTLPTTIGTPRLVNGGLRVSFR
jgi:iron complex outermembrane receptor protein